MEERHIYLNKWVYFPLNIAGVIISVVGLIICIGIMFGSHTFSTRIIRDSHTIETALKASLNQVDGALKTANQRVQDFTTPEEIKDEVTRVVDRNIDRLESMRISLITVNLYGKLNRPIKEIDDAITKLNKIKEFSGGLLELKQAVVDKIDIFHQQIDDTNTQLSRGVRTVRMYARYSFYGTSILAVIFIAGQLSLLLNCTKRLRRHKRRYMSNYIE